MALPVSDRGANRPELIEHAALIIGRSKHRLAVFNEVYRGKKRVKSVSHLMSHLHLPRTRVLDAGRHLASNDIVNQVKVKGETGYEKVDFFARHRSAILRYVKKPKDLDKLPTKRRPAPIGKGDLRVRLDVRLPRAKVKARRITVDDINSFEKVKAHEAADVPRMSEERFKRGVAAILKEKGTFKDWGGELRDLKSSKLLIKGQRMDAAFAFKGPATTGRLTPAKMGKNGDQIQRLLRCPADVFIVQYAGEIDDGVVEQLEKLAQLKSFLESREVFYGVIDGDDTSRLVAAYNELF